MGQPPRFLALARKTVALEWRRGSRPLLAPRFPLAEAQFARLQNNRSRSHNDVEKVKGNCYTAF